MEHGGFPVNVVFRALDTDKDWPWVQKHLQLALTDNTSGVVAVNADTQELVGAMVCESWTVTSVQCHFIVEHRAALRHNFHRECARYVFTTGDRLKMIGIVPSNNMAALKINKKFGFTPVGVIEDAFEVGEHAVILEMHRDNCNYWEGFPVEHRRVAHG